MLCQIRYLNYLTTVVAGRQHCTVFPVMQIKSLAREAFWKFMTKVANFTTNALHLRRIISKLILVIFKALISLMSRWRWKSLIFLINRWFLIDFFFLFIFLLLLFFFRKLWFLFLNSCFGLLRLGYFFWSLWLWGNATSSVRTYMCYNLYFCLFSSLNFCTFFRSLFTVDLVKAVN